MNHAHGATTAKARTIRWGWIALAVLMLLHVAIKLHYGREAVHMTLAGDEIAYVDGAKALSNALRDLSSGTPLDQRELKRNVIGNGWFMPGMSLAMAPVFVVTPDASVETLRSFLGVLSFTLWLLAVLRVERHMGMPYALALALFPAISPVWIFFSYSAWGDLYGGLLMAIVLAELTGLLQRQRLGAELGWMRGLGLGLCLAAMLYLRSSLLPMVAIAFAALLVSGIIYRRNGFTTTLAALAAAVLSFSLVLAPWSIAASKVLGGRVITTTTTPLSLAITFGDRNEVCFSKCAGHNIWMSSVRHSRVMARNLEASELDVQKDMAKHALRNLTLAHYLRTVTTNFDAYLLRPDGFSEFFLRDYPRSPAASTPQERYQHRISTLTRYPYFLAMTAMFLAFLSIERKRQETQLVSLVLKAALVAAMVQPFVHVSGGRYWTSFAPLFALGAGHFFVWISGLFWHSDASAPADAQACTWLTGLQVVIVFGAVAIAVALLLAELI